MVRISTTNTTMLALLMTFMSLALLAQDLPTDELIARRSEAFDRAFSQGDIETIASFFAADIVIISAGGNATSFEQVLEDHKEMFESRPGLTMSHKPESIEVGPEDWGLAAEQGRWVEQWNQDGETVTLEGTYQTMWRLAEGSWVKAGQILIATRCEGSYCSD